LHFKVERFVPSIAFALLAQMTPNNYYKYRPLWDKPGEPNYSTRCIIEKSQLWYAKPSSFNDPYDCNLKLHIDDCTDAELQWYLNILKKEAPDLSHILQLDAIKSNPSIAASVGEKTRHKNFHKSSVLCLSRKSNSIPMFSYYADSHKGVAIEFQFNNYEIPCGIPCKEPGSDTVYGNKVVFRHIDYHETPPELNYIRLYGKPEIVFNTIFAKSHEWAHEQEFRIFRREVGEGLVNFEGKMLTRIIFGCRSSKKEIDLVKSWLAGRKSDVILSIAKESPNKFELEIEDFETVRAIS